MKYPFLSILFFVLTLNAFSQTTYYVSADNGLYARVSPDRGSKAVAKLNYGTAVEIIENTDLKMDLKDGSQVMSGEWVKVRANVSYTDVDAYVFNAYLSNEKPEPRSHILFEPFDVEIHNLKLHETEKNTAAIIRDSAHYFIEPGDTPESKTLRIKPNENYKKIEVYQAIETSLTISDQGPHCDLLDWKHFKSSWMPLTRLDKTSFTTRTIDRDMAGKFPEVTEEEILAAIQDHCGEDWVKVAHDWKKSGYKAYSTEVSTIYFKIIMTDLNNNRIEKIVAVELPMGC